MAFIVVSLFGVIFLTEIGLTVFTQIWIGSNAEILHLTRWLFPGILFIALYGLNISFLHCYNHFFIPSFAPFMCNVVWIGAVFLLRTLPTPIAMIQLAKCIVLGWIAQWVVTSFLMFKKTLPIWKPIWKEGWKEILTLRIPLEVKQLIQSFSLAAIGVGAAQINNCIDLMFARYADVQGPIYLWYSIRLEQLCFAVIGLACVYPIIPRLSRAVHKEKMENQTPNFEKAKNLFSSSYHRIIAFTIPTTFAIATLSFSWVNLVYGRGSFSEPAIFKTAICLLSYGLGLVPTTLTILLSSIFYARDNFKSPSMIVLFTVGANLLLNSLCIFIGNFGPASIAVTTSLSAWMNCAALQYQLSKLGWNPFISLSKIMKTALISLLAGLVTVGFDMGWGCFHIGGLSMGITYPHTFLEQCSWFGKQAFLFAATLFILAKTLKLETPFEILTTLFKKEKPFRETPN